MPKIVTIKEAAKIFNLTEWALRNGAKSGMYPHFKIGNKYVFDVEVLDAYLKKLAVDGLAENN